MMWGTPLVGILAQPWARRAAAFALVALTISLFLLNLRRAGERAGRAAERLENMERTRDANQRMLEAASDRPRNHNDLLGRLPDGHLELALMPELLYK
jgi:type II secretory pathway component PulJ